MDPRYLTPEMTKLLSQESVFEKRKMVLQFVAELQERYEIIPPGVNEAIRGVDNPTVKHVQQVERTTKHDIAAYVTALRHRVKDKFGTELASFVYHEMTSSDLVDTVQGWMLKSARQIMAEEIYSFTEPALNQFADHAPIERIGRTHGQYAELVSGSNFAYATAERLRFARNSFGEVPIMMKLSGPVGEFTTPDKRKSRYVETDLAGVLQLTRDRHATQITDRSQIARYAFECVNICGIAEQFATNVRLLAIQDVSELTETFTPGQVGSSAMPHKRNPINAERLVGISRLARGYLSAILETSYSSWLERDISNSSVERVALWDLVALTHFSLVELGNLAKSLQWHTAIVENTVRNYGKGSALEFIKAVQDGEDAKKAYGRIQKEHHSGS